MDAYADAFQQNSPAQQLALMKGMSAEELEALYAVPEARCFPKQVVPRGDWRYLLMRCGRGFGKSMAGSAWLASKVMEGAKQVALYGATHEDVSKIMVPALLSWFPPKAAKYNAQNHTITFANGAECHCLTSEKEQRGFNLEYLWVDEICNHADGIPEKIERHFDTLDFCVRVGRNPQVLITSTPKPFAWFKTFQLKADGGSKRHRVVTGTCFDNPYYSDSAREALVEKHGTTRVGRQEIYGDLLLSVEGALWSGKQLDATRVDLHPTLCRTVVAVDPAVTNTTKSDSTGISVCALGEDGHLYVLADLSGRYSPAEWRDVAAKAFEDHGADCLVYEQNQGGLLVEQNLRSHPALAQVRIKAVVASKGKQLRAEPVAALWEDTAVKKATAHIVGSLSDLEQQMTQYDGNPKAKSPDRLDAMVYAATELVLNRSYANRDLSALESF